jgi:tetratricopeptide repeat protein 21B
MSKEFKPQAYNLIRRGWFDQLNALCDSIMTKKGKDPLTAFWKAFAVGMAGNITDSLRQLEAFQSRKDLQFPVTLALMYFHKKATPVDREAVAQLKSELSIAEDVAVSTLPLHFEFVKVLMLNHLSHRKRLALY